MRAGLLATAALLLLAGLGGCATKPRTGIIAGRFQPPGGTAAPVRMTWRATGANHGTLLLTLPGEGGERFQGQYVHLRSTTRAENVAPILAGWRSVWWRPGWGLGEPWLTGEPTFATYQKRYQGSILATLYGSSGSSMRCRFTLREPQRGLRGGGGGECEISDGGRVDLRF